MKILNIIKAKIDLIVKWSNRKVMISNGTLALILLVTLALIVALFDAAYVINQILSR